MWGELIKWMPAILVFVSAVLITIADALYSREREQQREQIRRERERGL